MKHDKAYYRKLAYQGWSWGGHEGDGLHIFFKRNGDKGWFESLIAERDIQDGSYQYMLRNGLSRTKPIALDVA